MDIVFLLVRLRKQVQDTRSTARHQDAELAQHGRRAFREGAGKFRASEAQRVQEDGKKDADEGFPNGEEEREIARGGNAGGRDGMGGRKRERGRMQLRDKSGVSVGRRREKLPEKELRCRNRINK
ncbi:hypothetical protein M431DRAFT_496252 [Trichoderma harzianum CBS 226.95]|uniref:Uncharacterized protein n=1 Tax=Trichoderma harzianum CBS 226.95 TaxID=983964 RepID=A0A2T4AB82_TRIHA|nr:hypothetical protein M431DRAFT_496252 [Trichoderma harzianum CBS 226.95]PTB54312.1 hypothetical protein M431DRAFT_496252 [Trichoderma harzianum CBS 226.95]